MTTNMVPTQRPGLPSTLGKSRGYQLELTKDLHETTPVLICQSNARILGDISHNLLVMWRSL